MPSWARNRFVVLFAVLTVVVGVWNLYVSTHDHGIVTGRVVDAMGHPVAGVVVHMFERDFISQQERAHTTTDAGGWFRFTTNASHVVQLQVDKGEARAPRVTVRLWFRAQDVALATPLVLP